jgi:hypothetical protein
MININLYTKEGMFIETIKCIEMHTMPDILLYNERHFIRKTYDTYIEGFCVAILTDQQYEEILSDARN